MKYQIVIPVLLTAAMLTGCGSAAGGTSSAATAKSTTASSTASKAAGTTSSVSSSSAQSSGDASGPSSSGTTVSGSESTYTDSELEETLSTDLDVLSGDSASMSDGGSIAEEYPDDDLESNADFGSNTDSAPSVDEEPASGTYDKFVTLADYKNITIEAPDGTAIEDGMTANIDYSGSLKGKAIEGGSDTNFDLVIGSDSFVEGFEDQLIGHKKGDNFTIEVKFPSDYEETSLAGQTVQFNVRINRVYSTTTPDLAVSNVVDGSKILQYPKKMEDDWKQAYLTQFKQFSDEPSSDESKLLEENGYDEKSFTDLIHMNLKQELVYQAMLDKEGITSDSDTYKQATEAVLKNFGFKDAKEAASSGVTEQELRLNVEEKLAESIVVKYEKK